MSRILIARIRTSLNFTRILCVFVLLTFVSTVLTPLAVVAQAIPQDDYDAILNNSVHYKALSDECSSTDSSGGGSSGSGSGTGKLYLVGDSIAQASKGALESTLSSRGFSPVAINALASRNVSAGLTTLAQDAASQISGASVVVVQLGTNSVGLNAENIKRAVATIKQSAASAKIFWVNVGVDNSKRSGSPIDVNVIDALLKSNASAGYSVIDWKTVVEQHPDYIDGSDGVGVHPTASGKIAFAATIADGVTGGASVSTVSASNCTCAIGANVSLVGNDNIEKAFRFFVSKGFTPPQAAGILGNMRAESGVVPTKIQGGGDSKNPQDAGGLGWGIIQWTPGNKVLNVASQAGITTPIYELGTQLEIVWWHLNNVSPNGYRNVINGLKNTASSDEATVYFEVHMEGAGIKNYPLRKQFAREVLASYGGTVTTSSPVSGGCNLSSGQNTQYIDGFTIYSQYDPAWKDKPYSSSTIGRSGCGPTAMAMIITTLTGQRITPVETANYAASQGLYVPDDGSKWTIGPILAAHWRLKSEPIARDVGAITAALQAGKLIITPGAGALPFSQGGHFIVIRGATSDGKWLIGDSGHSGTSDKKWDPQQIIGSMSYAGQYAIYK